MRSLTREHKIFLKNNIGFCVLLIGEFIFLIWILLSLFYKPFSMDVPIVDMHRSDGNTEYLSREGGSLQIMRSQSEIEEIEQSNQEGTQQQELGAISLEAAPYQIRAGAYFITVEYKSQSDTENPSNSIEDHTGELYFTSTQNGQALQMDTIVLDDAHTSATGRMWTSMGAHIEDLKAYVVYSGTGLLQLKAIHIQEAVRYRAIRLLEVLILFGVIDFICFLFFIKKESKYQILPRGKTVLLLLGIALLASLPEFANFLLQGHDISFHLQRIAAVSRELSYGQFPVRMQSDVLNGYGYANSLYYCDIFLYIPALLYLMMVPLRTCYQIYVILVNMTTTFAIYYVLKEIARDSWIRWTGTILYVFAAYRLSDVYVRAAVGEYTAMVFLPLIVLGLYRIMKTEHVKVRDWMPLSIGFAGVLQSHTLSLEMTGIFLILFVIGTCKRVFTKLRFLALIKAGIVTCLLSAWFLVPFLDSMIHMNVAVHGENATVNQIQKTGLYISQILGIFGNGSGDGYAAGMQNEFAMTLGPALLVGILVIGYCMWNRQKWSLEESFPYQAMRVALILACISIIFTMQIFPWDSVEGIFGKKIAQIAGAVQLSWRYLEVATVLLVFASVIALGIIKQYRPRFLSAFLIAMLSATVLYSGFFFYQFTSSAQEEANNSASPQSLMWVQGGEYYLEGTDTASLEVAEAETKDNYCVLIAYQKERGIGYLTVKNLRETQTQASVPITHYDYYKAFDTVTGEQVKLETGKNDRIVLDIPGNYAGTIEIRYVPPMGWHVAELVTALSLIGVISWKMKTKRGRTEK